MNGVGERDFWLQMREALLHIVDAIERKAGVDISPTTADLRKLARITK